MIFLQITLLLGITQSIGCEPHWLNTFSIERSKTNNAIILSEIITNYIVKYFSKEKIRVSMILKTSKKDKFHFEEEYFDHLFNDLDQAEFAHRIVDKLDNATYGNKNAFNLILVDDCSILPEILNESTVYEVHLTHFFLVAIIKQVQNTSQTLNTVIELLWRNSLLNSNVLIQEEPRIWSMFTFMPFQRSCFSLDPLKVATFTPQNFTDNINATLSELFPEKLFDFCDCPLYVAPSLLEPYTSMRVGSDGKPQYKGIDISILVHVSKALNFSIIYKRASNASGHGHIFPNGTLTENIKLLYEGKVNLSTGGYGSTMMNSILFSMSVPYVHSSLGFVFREREIDSSLTKLLAPFEVDIWLMISGLLIIAFVAILLTKKLSRRWRHFIIGGRRNRTPILNMWNAVMGGPIMNPRMRNRRTFGTFARTLLLLWILLWFIIRQGYQGTLYKFLQRHQYSTDYNTIDKIMGSDCKILIAPTAPKSVYMFDSKRFIYGGPEIMENIRKFYDDNVKGVALSTELMQQAFNLANPSRRLGFTKDRIYMSSSVFLFHKKSMLTRVFNDEILKLKEFGLHEIWNKALHDAQKKAKTKKTQPTKLGMNNVLAAFQICGVLYAFSFFVFILEILSVKFPRVKYVLDYLTY